MAWNEISLDDLDELTNELKITGENFKKEAENKKNDSNKGVDTRASVKSAGKEDEDDWDEDNVQTDIEDEEHDEAEPEDEDEVVDEDQSPTRNRGAKPDGKLDRNQSDETEAVRRALAEVQRERDSALAQLAEAEKTQSTLRKTTLESQRDSVVGEIKTLKAQLSKAKQDGDYEAETDLLLEIQKKQLRELAIESALEDTAIEAATPKREAPRTTQQVAQPQANTMPPEAQKFVQRNAWIANAPETVRMAIVTQSQMMIDQGKDPNKAEFYDALSKRLNAVLDGTGYTVAGGESTARKAEAPAKKRGSPLPPKEQTTKVYRDANGNTKVVATRADKDMAEKMGLDLKVYMKNKLKMEKATGGVAANWAPIEV